MNKNMEPWEAYPEIWKTKAAFFAWLRGGLRRAVWEKYPPKIKFKNDACTPPPPTYTGKAKSGTNCALTGDWIAKSYLEVDHIEGHVSLKEWNDLTPFIQHLCTSSDNMQLVGKEAHKVKSYSERKGVSFDDALLEKKVIQIIKNKQDKQFFLDRELEVPKNAKERRDAILTLLKKEVSV